MTQPSGKSGERGLGGGRFIGEYLVGKQIGSGSFSVVWHARHRVHGTQVAIKEISMSRLNKKLQDSLLSEIFILKQINHPNIIRLHDIIEAPGKIHLVLEFCSGGDLFKYIQRHRRVPEATAKHFMQQLAAGLKVLRDNNIIHRDLKPQNLLLSTNENNSVLKIADFGFARSLQPRGLAETLCGSPLYMAPEIMQLQKYDAKADLWSVGAILYQLVTGKTPFSGSNQIELLQNIIKATELRFPSDMEDLSSQFVDLCQKLLRRNPVERLTFDEFFNHPFLFQKELNEISGHCTLSNRATSYSLSECNLLKNKEDHSSDDCLPFLLDDDSSGYDGSPSFNRRRPSMKSSHNLYFDSRKEAVSSTMRHVDHSSRQCNRTQRLLSRGFRIDDSTSNLHREQPSACMEKRPVSYHPRALDSLEFNDQDYVLVSGPPLDVKYSSPSKSKPSLSSTKSELPLPISPSISSRSSSPMPILGPSIGYPCSIETVDNQSSAPPGMSPGSMDTIDGLEQPSSDSLTRLKSLQECAASVKELVNEMIEADRVLEAFSIQLVVLAVWKQALHICHTQAVSSRDGSPSPDIAKSVGSVGRIKNSPDFHESLDAVCSQVLVDVSMVIKREFFNEVEHAEGLSKFVKSGSAELPDAMETIYQSALALGRHGAVDELMGDMESATSSYSKAVRLLVFLLVEAPCLILNPPFNLTNSDRFRLRNYITILNDRQGISRSQRMALLKPEGDECPP
ncbi:serine/threonine-protein kinase ATG1c isoform X1 [Amaranthus tricolor]|uniref:serine/threonine-protein kinase ATG1c isoform X1 n=1 Tax=Amaranthus tricolor TaxID=29722 RepID=UPI00258C1DB4|nr:serine/threonine-protein kinase ATG1c isoform X1 [Amaranthus tricolor]